MNSVRVDVTYRPLRVGWAVRDDDINEFRRVAQLSCALWGGRYNPILPVSRPDHARRLIDAFRVDAILPVGGSAEVATFIASVPHLIDPFHREGVFVGGPPFETKS